MPVVVAIFSFLGRVIRGAPLWALVAAGIVLFYEGIPPIPFSLPFIGDVSLIDGRVDKVRKSADERCRRQKIESQRLADQADQIQATEAARRHAAAIQEAERRRAAAEVESQNYENEIAQLEPQLRGCRLATDNDLRRLR